MINHPNRSKHKTPFEKHQALGHKMTIYSPNGVDRIHECIEKHCGLRFLENCGEITIMYPYLGIQDNRL